jgi:hypothetical protein
MLRSSSSSPQTQSISFTRDRASVNFSGRLTRSQPTAEEFESLLEQATSLDTRPAQQAMVEGYRLTDRARQWVDLSGQVIDGEVRLDAQNRVLYRPLAKLYTSALMGGAAAEAKSQLIAREADGLRTQLAEESACAADEVRALTTGSQRSRRVAPRSRPELELHRAALGSPGAREALWMASAANGLRLTLLPEAARRHGLFRATVGWARGLTST